MNCSKCGGKTRVLDGVQIVKDFEMYRKRKCDDCGYMFYTTEFKVERDKMFIKNWNRYHRYRGAYPKNNEEEEEEIPKNKKLKKSDFTSEFKTNALIAAKELKYGARVINLIEAASTDSVVNKIMHDARLGFYAKKR